VVPKALIFDFDGLIVDTESIEYEAWRVAFERHGAELPRGEWIESIGTDGRGFDPMARLRELSGRAVDEADLHAHRRSLRDGLLQALEPLPGVVEWLEDARRAGLGLAIASSSPRDWVEPQLERIGLRQFFSELITSERAPRAKPYPDLYQTAVRALDVNPQDAWALEDSPNGLRAARSAGLHCLVIPGPMTREGCFDDATLQLESLAQQSLQETIRRLARQTARLAPLGSFPESKS